MTELCFKFGLRAFRLQVPEAEAAATVRGFADSFPGWTRLRTSPAEATELTLPPREKDSSDWFLRLLDAFQTRLGAEGFAPFHGAALSRDDRLVLVCGVSGAGKSLFSLLLGERLDILADDLFFARVTANELELVPLPRRVASKSPQYRKLAIEAKEPHRATYDLARTTLVFPSFESAGVPTPLAGAAAIFPRLLKGNLFGDPQRSLANAGRQLSLRRALSERCRALLVPYSDQDAGEVARRLLRDLAL